MAIFGHTGVGLDIFRHMYFHKSIDDAVEHAETCVDSSVLKGSPAKFLQHRCNTRYSARLVVQLSFADATISFLSGVCSFSKGVPIWGRYTLVGAILRCCRQSLSQSLNNNRTPDRTPTELP